MSRTDKTDPYWVQLRDPGFKWPIRAHHQCYGSSYRNARACDLDFPGPPTRGKWRGCEYWPRYWDNDKLYGRPRYRRSHGSFQDRKARADLRRLRAAWVRESDREEIDSTHNAPSRRWCWRRWYWD